jgi:hypothetical protein
MLSNADQAQSSSPWMRSTAARAFIRSAVILFFALLFSDMEKPPFVRVSISLINMRKN